MERRLGLNRNPFNCCGGRHGFVTRRTDTGEVKPLCLQCMEGEGEGAAGSDRANLQSMWME